MRLFLLQSARKNAQLSSQAITNKVPIHLQQNHLSTTHQQQNSQSLLITPTLQRKQSFLINARHFSQSATQNINTNTTISLNQSQIHLPSSSKPTSRKPIVAVGLSGGVDSAVTALLLKERGFDVKPVFMVNWDPIEEQGICPGEQDKLDALSVATHLGLELHEVNFVKEYWLNVFEEMLEGYRHGYTPNPDVLCNRFVKFAAFKDYAIERLQADYIAFGHYSRVLYPLHEDDLELRFNSDGTVENYTFDPLLAAKPGTGASRLITAVDPVKDQTYFLSHVLGGSFDRLIFPIGQLQKSQVRDIATKWNIPVAKKHDSTGLCFVGPRSFKKLVDGYVPPEELLPGPVITLHDMVMMISLLCLSSRPYLEKFTYHSMKEEFIVSKDTPTSTSNDTSASASTSTSKLMHTNTNEKPAVAPDTLLPLVRNNLKQKTKYANLDNFSTLHTKLDSSSNCFADRYSATIQLFYKLQLKADENNPKTGKNDIDNQNIHVNGNDNTNNFSNTYTTNINTNHRHGYTNQYNPYSAPSHKHLDPVIFPYHTILEELQNSQLDNLYPENIFYEAIELLRSPPYDGSVYSSISTRPLFSRHVLHFDHDGITTLTEGQKIKKGGLKQHLYTVKKMIIPSDKRDMMNDLALDYNESRIDIIGKNYLKKLSAETETEAEAGTATGGIDTHAGDDAADSGMDTYQKMEMEMMEMELDDDEEDDMYFYNNYLQNSENLGNLQNIHSNIGTEDTDTSVKTINTNSDRPIPTAYEPSKETKILLQLQKQRRLQKTRRIDDILSRHNWGVAFAAEKQLQQKTTTATTAKISTGMNLIQHESIVIRAFNWLAPPPIMAEPSIYNINTTNVFPDVIQKKSLNKDNNIETTSIKNTNVSSVYNPTDCFDAEVIQKVVDNLENISTNIFHTKPDPTVLLNIVMYAMNITRSTLFPLATMNNNRNSVGGNAEVPDGFICYAKSRSTEDLFKCQITAEWIPVSLLGSKNPIGAGNKSVENTENLHIQVDDIVNIDTSISKYDADENIFEPFARQNYKAIKRKTIDNVLHELCYRVHFIEKPKSFLATGQSIVLYSQLPFPKEQYEDILLQNQKQNKLESLLGPSFCTNMKKIEATKDLNNKLQIQKMVQLVDGVEFPDSVLPSLGYKIQQKQQKQQLMQTDVEYELKQKSIAASQGRIYVPRSSTQDTNANSSHDDTTPTPIIAPTTRWECLGAGIILT